MPVYSVIAAINNTLLRTEKSLLAFALLAMLGLAVAQIILRNIFGFGIVWGESLVRILVLWVALLGAMVASHSNEHIKIDILSRLLPEQLRAWMESATNLIAAVVCGISAYYAANFVYLEYEDGLSAFANVPTWLCAIIIPVAFILMGLRYLAASLLLCLQRKPKQQV